MKERGKIKFSFYARARHMSLAGWSRLAPFIGSHLALLKRGNFSDILSWLKKICLILRAKAPVSTSRLSLLPTGAVSKGSQIIYQNAQDKALNVV